MNYLIEIDERACAAHGDCVDLAPRAFDPTGEGGRAVGDVDLSGPDPFDQLDQFVVIGVAGERNRDGAEPAMRGRVMSLWAVSAVGMRPVGGPVIGFAGEDVVVNIRKGNAKP